MNVCTPRYLTTWHIKQIPIAGPAHHSPNAQTSASQTQLPAASNRQDPGCRTACLIPSWGAATSHPTSPPSTMQPQHLAVPMLHGRACPLCPATDAAELQSVMPLQLPDCFSTCKRPKQLLLRGQATAQPFQNYPKSKACNCSHSYN